MTAGLGKDRVPADVKDETAGILQAIRDKSIVKGQGLSLDTRIHVYDLHIPPDPERRS